jgi:hypothetical protein
MHVEFGERVESGSTKTLVNESSDSHLSVDLTLRFP